MSCYIATIKRNNFLTPFVNKSTYQPPKARKVSFFCNWRMQMRQRHERGLVLHSHATCRTQIYAEYTGGTIIIRLMHSTRGEHNLKLVGTGCDPPLWIVVPLSEEFRGIICVHSWFSLCVIYRERFFPIRLAKLWFHHWKNKR